MKSLDFSSHLLMISPFTFLPRSLNSSILFCNRNFFSFRNETFSSFAVQPRARLRLTQMSQSLTILATMSDVDTPINAFNYNISNFFSNLNSYFQIYLQFFQLPQTFHVVLVVHRYPHCHQIHKATRRVQQNQFYYSQ